ncbi:hypothetical protein ACFFSQ_36905 [Dactylosporangium matsuzakiense]
MTGAAGGIGYGIAQAFADRGMSVVLAERSYREHCLQML